MNFLTPQYFTSIDDALDSLFGKGTRIAQTDRISGGDINEAYGLTLTNGAHIFIKSNTKENIAFFSAEAAGLNAIAKTKSIATPHILCYGTQDGTPGYSFLLLEFINEKRRIPNYWETFAGQLAAMHKSSTADFVPHGKYGFIQDNYIGAGEQLNTPKENWIDFFRCCRLEPQFKRASSCFGATDFKRITRLLDHLDDFLTEPVHPSLLHGDLWSGNFITGNDGKAWLIDPAAYVGHAEADIAMTELFGGFSPAFYAAYQETAPMQPGYHDRRDLYNLYHLLNHLNLFGRSYLASVQHTLAKYVS